MTRESKLALIVGFGLILFVGILVSDHFSQGQRQEAAHLLAQRGGARGGSLPISIQPLAPAARGDTRQVRSDDVPAPEVVPTPPEVVVPPRGRTIGPEPTPSGAGPAPRDDQNSANPEVHTPPPAVPETERITLYPVKEGETLFSICASHYGDGTLWPALAEFNKSAVPKPARMRSGVTLRLPPIEVLKPSLAGRSNTTTPAPSTPPGAPVPAAAPSSPVVPSTTSYIVQRGETLTGIAEKKLGSSSRWKELATLNADVVPDPNTLMPGTVIRVPLRS